MKQCKQTRENPTPPTMPICKHRYSLLLFPILSYLIPSKRAAWLVQYPIIESQEGTDGVNTDINSLLYNNPMISALAPNTTHWNLPTGLPHPHNTYVEIHYCIFAAYSTNQLQKSHNIGLSYAMYGWIMVSNHTIVAFHVYTCMSMCVCVCVCVCPCIIVLCVCVCV